MFLIFVVSCNALMRLTTNLNQKRGRIVLLPPLPSLRRFNQPQPPLLAPRTETGCTFFSYSSPA